MKFARGNDGGAYVIANDPNSSSTDPRIQVRAAFSPARPCPLPHDELDTRRDTTGTLPCFRSPLDDHLGIGIVRQRPPSMRTSCIASCIAMHASTAWTFATPWMDVTGSLLARAGYGDPPCSIPHSFHAFG
eukprot:360908-Chlamydomonas_euryale.AAC.17